MTHRIETIRNEIAAGTYETDAKLDATTDKVLDAIVQAPPPFGDSEPADPIQASLANDEAGALYEHHHRAPAIADQ